MHLTRRLVIWSLRSWPALVIGILAFIHFVLISDFGLNVSTTNKTFALITQIIGGLVILYTIDSNVGIMSRKNLLATLTSYLRQFPLFKKVIVLKVAPGSVAIIAGRVRLSTSRKPTSIEEKIDYLQEQVNKLKEELEVEIGAIQKKMDRQAEEFTIQIQETKSALNVIESKVVKVAVDGLKIQLFGVSLMIYGAVSGYFA